MSVLHVVGGGLGGGAARGAFTLSEALNGLGVRSVLLCADPGPLPPGTTSLAGGPAGRAAAVLRAKAESLPLRLLYPRRRTGIFSVGRTGIDLTRLEDYRQADIVHLHWINRGMLSIEGLGALRKPCVWTMRDMWPFTGGCHYALGCTRYEGSCGACPALGSRRDPDLSSRVLRRKRRTLPGDIVYVGISDWLSGCARRSGLLAGADIRTIPNCIDTAVFRPMPKDEARQRLGLPADRRILLHGALSLGDAYKGSELLERAKAGLAPPGPMICTFGAGGELCRSDRNFGVIRDDALLRTLYAAADVLVFPSRQEAFGKVLAEALACGTPAVAFDATGPGEILVHERTGYAARPFEAEDLAAGIAWVLADDARHRALCAAAGEDARARFSGRLSAERYRALYLELLGRRPGCAPPG